MNYRTLKIVLLISVCALTLFGFAACSNGEETKTGAPGEQISITMGIEGGAGLPDAIMGQAFKDALEEKSNGRFVVDYYLNGQLGGDAELLQQTMNGSIQAAVISTSTFSDYNEALDVLQLPFLFSSYDIEKQALKSDEAKALFEELEPLNVKILAVCEIGMRNFANNVRPITRMEDLKGIKMRIVPSTLVARTAELIGMSVTPMSYGEIYTGLQQKVIDGEEINFISIAEERHYEVLKYISTLNFYTFPSALTLNLDFYNGLSEEDKVLIDECKTEAFEYAMNQTKIAEENSIEIAKNAGVEINEISEEEIDRFKAAVEPIYKEYADKSPAMAAFIEMAQNL